MAPLDQVIEQYSKACKKQGVSVHPFVMKMFDFLTTRGSKRGAVHLQLAGDNYLMTIQRIFDADILPLCTMLNSSAIVTSVDLRYNKISDHGAVVISQMLEKNSYLKHLSLTCNDIGPEGGAAIAKSLMKNSVLKSLQLTGNKIGKMGGMSLAEALQINNSLEALDCGDCDLEIDSLIALATVLRANTSIKSLNVSRPLLTTVQEESLVHYGQMIQVNSSLEELHLEKTDIRDFGTARLSDALILNSHLKALNLASNRITRDGATELVRALSMNFTLKVLDLGANRLEDPGAARLAQCLTIINNSLEVLIVTFNNIKSDGLVALATMLKTNFVLQEIYVWGNIFDDQSARAFQGLIKSGRLDKAKVDIRPYEVDGVYYVAQINSRPGRHRYWMPYYGDDVPEENQGFADFVRVYGSAIEAANKPSKVSVSHA